MLNVAVSRDGRRWEAALVLENQTMTENSPTRQSSRRRTGWSMSLTPGKRERIKHVVINPAALTLRPILDGQWPRASNGRCVGTGATLDRD